MKLVKSHVDGGRAQFTATFKPQQGNEVHSYGFITEDESEAREKILEWAESKGYSEEDFI